MAGAILVHRAGGADELQHEDSPCSAVVVSVAGKERKRVGHDGDREGGPAKFRTEL